MTFRPSFRRSTVAGQRRKISPPALRQSPNTNAIASEHDNGAARQIVRNGGKVREQQRGLIGRPARRSVAEHDDRWTAGVLEHKELPKSVSADTTTRSSIAASSSPLHRLLQRGLAPEHGRRRVRPREAARRRLEK